MAQQLLKTLQLTEREMRNAVDPFTRIKQKLISNLKLQKQAADAMIEGKPFMVPRMITVDEDGVRIRKQVNKPIKQWYWRDAVGQVRFSIRIANKAIEIEKGKTDIIVGEDKKLPDTVELVLKAVEAGELDAVIKQSIQKTKS